MLLREVDGDLYEIKETYVFERCTGCVAESKQGLCSELCSVQDIVLNAGQCWVKSTRKLMEET